MMNMQGLDTGGTINWLFIRLSGGQINKVTIACSLITRPAIIAKHDPTSGLDADNAEGFIGHLKSLVSKQCVQLESARC